MIRPATFDDTAAIAAIYADHVLTGTATFDVDPPSAAHWDAKIGGCSARQWPFLVAAGADGTALGYAYITQFRDRPAYAHSCENSIYVRADMIGRGIGRTLLSALIDAAAVSGFAQMIAVMSGGNPASVALHEALGFEHAGRLRNVGKKFGQLLDTIYMQRALGGES